MSRIVLFSLFNLVFCTITFAQSEWKLAKKGDGIKIYLRNNEGSKYKEFKAITIIKAKHTDIAEEIMDVASYPEWYPDVESAEVIKKVSSTESLVYYLVDVPWPAANRDAVNSLKLSSSKNVITILSKPKSGVKSLVKDVIRIKDATGTWVLTYENGYTKVSYQMLADPGGNLPAWIINMFIVDGPYKTLQALRDRVE